MRRLIGVVGLVTVTAAQAAAQTVTQGNVTLRLGGRFQYQFNTTSVDETEIRPPGEAAQLAGSTFETRRVRLTFRLAIDEWITARVEPEFSLGNLALRNAWMNLAFSDAFQLQFGQYKKPFSLIWMSSSLEMPSIERGQRIRGLHDYLSQADAAAGGPVLSALGGTPLIGEEHDLLDTQGYLGYEMGASALGVIGPFEWHVGIFNGTGPDSRDVNDRKSFAGRIVWTVPSATPLRLGASASHHEVETSATAPIADGAAFEIDVELGEFRRPGLHLLAEAATGTNLASEERLLGVQAMAAFFRPLANARVDGLEPTARISWADPDRTRDGDEGMFLTPGFNIYFTGTNRLMLNWEVFVPSGDRFETRHALRAQAQLTW